MQRPINCTGHALGDGASAYVSDGVAAQVHVCEARTAGQRDAQLHRAVVACRWKRAHVHRGTRESGAMFR